MSTPELRISVSGETANTVSLNLTSRKRITGSNPVSRTKERGKPDALFVIRARIDTGNRNGAHQLRKDLRALKIAEEEIVRLRAEVVRLKNEHA